MQDYYGWGLPKDFSTNGYLIDRLIIVIHVFMAILFAAWFVFFLYAVWKFRERSDRRAAHEVRRFKLPTYAEAGVAVVEILLLAAFSFPIWQGVKNELPSKEKALQVRVVAEQFAWNVHYPGKDGVFGRTDPKRMEASNPLGLDPEDPAGKDDIRTINQLHVPVHAPVIVRLSSKDVVHSFFLPVMRVKQDMIPGQTMPIWFQAKGTGQFEIACAQLCGLGHYRMRGFFIVETQEQFESWLAEQAGV